MTKATNLLTNLMRMNNKIYYDITLRYCINRYSNGIHREQQADNQREHILKTFSESCR